MNSDIAQVSLAFVDDHNLVRKGLIKLVDARNSSERYSVLFEADHGLDFTKKIAIHGVPDIAFMDIDMPEMDGYATVEWIKANHPQIKVIIVSMFDSEEAVIRMVRLGVDGYISKDLEVADIHEALTNVQENKGYYPPFVAQIMADNIGKINTSGIVKTGPLAGVSEREREFLEWVPSDLTYEQIADKMNVSPKTIDSYRKSLFTKFNVASRQGLTRYLFKNSILK